MEKLSLLTKFEAVQTDKLIFTKIGPETANVAEVAAIALFLRFYNSVNLGKRDYNSDKQQ